MATVATGQWPARSPLPNLTELDAETLRTVAAFTERLRDSRDSYADRVVALTRAHIPGYAVATDESIRESARHSVDDIISELAILRRPNDAARERLESLALQRAAQGMPLDTLSLGYRLGSREMLAMMDEIAFEVGLPHDLVLAMHDSTWEFANEAAAVFARIQHDLAVEQVRFDAERRSAFARGVLTGSIPADQILRDADLFGLDAHTGYAPLAVSATSQTGADGARRALASALRTAPDRLLFAEVGSHIGCIAPAAPKSISGHLVAVGPTLRLDELAEGFEEAVLTLESAERFGLDGVVRLADLGPRPLVMSASAAAILLERRHFAALDGEGRSGSEIEETTRIFLECNQQVGTVAERLTVHPNTVRYRVNRFRELTGLDVHRTEDLVTAWWLLNRRRSLPEP